MIVNHSKPISFYSLKASELICLLFLGISETSDVSSGMLSDPCFRETTTEAPTELPHATTVLSVNVPTVHHLLSYFIQVPSSKSKRLMKVYDDAMNVPDV